MLINLFFFYQEWFSLSGGLTAVIYTDAVQTVVMTVGAIALTIISKAIINIGLVLQFMLVKIKVLSICLLLHFVTFCCNFSEVQYHNASLVYFEAYLILKS